MDVESPAEVSHLFLVMEFVTTDLNKLMQNVEQIHFDYEHVKCLIYNILCAIKFLH